MLVKNKNSKIKVDVGVISSKKINQFSNKIKDYLNGDYHPDFEPDLAYRYIQANKVVREQEAEIKEIIKENEIKEIVESILAEKSQGGNE